MIKVIIKLFSAYYMSQTSRALKSQ